MALRPIPILTGQRVVLALRVTCTRQTGRSRGAPFPRQKGVCPSCYALHPVWSVVWCGSEHQHLLCGTISEAGGRLPKSLCATSGREPTTNRARNSITITPTPQWDHHVHSRATVAHVHTYTHKRKQVGHHPQTMARTGDAHKAQPPDTDAFRNNHRTKEPKHRVFMCQGAALG